MLEPNTVTKFSFGAPGTSARGWENTFHMDALACLGFDVLYERFEWGMLNMNCLQMVGKCMLNSEPLSEQCRLRKQMKGSDLLCILKYTPSFYCVSLIYGLHVEIKLLDLIFVVHT